MQLGVVAIQTFYGQICRSSRSFERMTTLRQHHPTGRFDHLFRIPGKECFEQTSLSIQLSSPPLEKFPERKKGNDEHPPITLSCGRCWIVFLGFLDQCIIQILTIKLFLRCSNQHNTCRSFCTCSSS